MTVSLEDAHTSITQGDFERITFVEPSSQMVDLLESDPGLKIFYHSSPPEQQYIFNILVMIRSDEEREAFIKEVERRIFNEEKIRIEGELICQHLKEK